MMDSHEFMMRALCREAFAADSRKRKASLCIEIRHLDTQLGAEVLDDVAEFTVHDRPDEQFLEDDVWEWIEDRDYAFEVIVGKVIRETGDRCGGDECHETVLSVRFDHTGITFDTDPGFIEMDDDS